MDTTLEYTGIVGLDGRVLQHPDHQFKSGCRLDVRSPLNLYK